MKTNKLLIILPLFLVPYLHMSGQEFGVANFDTVGISQYFNSEDSFDSIVPPPPFEYIEIILYSLTGDEPSSRNNVNDNYLFPITVKDQDHCERIIVTANALYDSYGRPRGMDLNEFRRFLKKTLINDDTIMLSRPYPILLYSANYKVISYNYPDFLYFRDDPVAFIRHYFPQGYGKYYYCFDDEQACVVEQLYRWGILVSDAGGAESDSYFYLSQSDLIRMVRLLPESDKEKKWKEIIQNKKLVETSNHTLEQLHGATENGGTKEFKSFIELFYTISDKDSTPIGIPIGYTTCPSKIIDSSYSSFVNFIPYFYPYAIFKVERPNGILLCIHHVCPAEMADLQFIEFLTFDTQGNLKNKMTLPYRKNGCLTDSFEDITQIYIAKERLQVLVERIFYGQTGSQKIRNSIYNIDDYGIPTLVID